MGWVGGTTSTEKRGSDAELCSKADETTQSKPNTQVGAMVLMELESSMGRLAVGSSDQAVKEWILWALLCSVAIAIAGIGTGAGAGAVVLSKRCSWCFPAKNLALAASRDPGAVSKCGFPVVATKRGEISRSPNCNVG